MHFSFATCAVLASTGVSIASSLEELSLSLSQTLPTLKGAATPSVSPNLTKRPTSPLAGTAAIPAFDLPSLLCNAPCTADPATIEAIRTTLALYPLAIDGKNFATLSSIFTSNAAANYSAPLDVLTPLSTIQSVLESSLAAVTTQHSFATQIIDILSPTEAFSVTYYTATHFGKGPFLGGTATAYGQYQDVWAKQSDGSWKISHRNLVYMGPFIGNLTIFTYTGA